MKFNHPIDTKSFIIGVIASMTAVIIWDMIKYNKKLLEFKELTNQTNQ
jgi:hypothetical protein